MNSFELFGLLGVLTYIGSYVVLQTGYVKDNSLAYILTSMLSAVLILISLSESFNLAAALVQVFWIIISLVGVFRLFYGKMTAYKSAKRQVSSRRRRNYRSAH